MERLMRHRSIDTSSGCWNWTGSTRRGYGRMIIGSRSDGSRRNAGVHVVSFIEHGGALGDGHDVCHSCDNRRCFNPAHLFSGTRKDNIQDAITKGRFVYLPIMIGERHVRAKLSDAQVGAIRKSTESSRAEAKRYDISPSYVRQLRRNEYRSPEPPKT